MNLESKALALIVLRAIKPQFGAGKVAGQVAKAFDVDREAVIAYQFDPAVVAAADLLGVAKDVSPAEAKRRLEAIATGLRAAGGSSKTWAQACRCGSPTARCS